MAGVNKNKLLDNATKYIQKGQLDRAIKELQKVIEADPSDVRTRLKLGDLFAKKNQNAEAAEQYNLVAESYSKDGFYLKAVAVYKQILKLDSSLIDVHLKLGDLYHQLGLLSDAMSQYQIVATHYDQKGMSKESLATLRKMVELDPENVQSRKKLAEIVAREGDTGAAIEEFVKIAEDLKAKGRLDDLTQVLERIIHLDAGRLDTVRELAGLYLERGDPKRALAKLQICFKTNPHDLSTLEMLSKAFVALGQPEKAKSVYREIAKIHDSGGNQAAKTEALRAILQLDPNDYEARAALEGRAPMQAEPSMGSMPSMSMSSAPSYEQPMAPVPPMAPASAPMQMGTGGPGDDPQTISKLLTEADVYLKYGLLEKALDHLRGIVRRNPGNLDAHLKLKDVYLQHKDAEGAVNEIVAVVDLALAQGDRARAQEVLAEGAQIAPGHPSLAAKQAQVGGGPPPAAAWSAAPPTESGAVEISIDAGEGVSIEDPAASEEQVEISVDQEIEIPDDGGVEIQVDMSASDKPFEESVDVSISDDAPAIQSQEEDVAIITDSEEMIVADPEPEPPPPPPTRSPSRPPEPANVVSIASRRPQPQSEGRISVPEPAALTPDQLINELAVAFENTGSVRSDAKTDAPEPAPEMEISIDAGEEMPVDLGTDDAIAVDDAPAVLAPPPPVKAVPVAQPMARTEESKPIPKAAPTVPLAAVPTNNDPIPAGVQEDVDEAEFFIKQEIYDEAVAVFKRLLKKYPGNGGLTAKLAQAQALMNGEAPPKPAARPAPAAIAPKPAEVRPVEAKISPVDVRPAAKAPAPPPPAEETGGFDLAAELMAELDSIAEQEEEGAPSFDENEQVSVGDVLREFKKGVDKQIGTEDKQARYDLGIAYREMGLLDEAIGEFEIASKEPSKRADCFYMIGMCQRDKGELDAAIKSFSESIKTAGVSDKQKASYFYELAATFETKGDASKAAKSYQQVQALDPGFRDVAEKLKATGGAPAVQTPNKKISYV